jgi:cAMP-dependent protein kinase regulator
MFDSLQI